MQAASPLINQLRSIKQFKKEEQLFYHTLKQVNELIRTQEEQLATLRQDREKQACESDAQLFCLFCDVIPDGDKVSVVASNGTRLVARKETVMGSPVVKAVKEQHTNEIVFPDVSFEALRQILFNMHCPDVCLRRAGAIDVSAKQIIAVLLESCRFASRWDLVDVLETMATELVSILGDNDTQSVNADMIAVLKEADMHNESDPCS